MAAIPPAGETLIDLGPTMAKIAELGEPVDSTRMRLEDPRSGWVIEHGHLDLFATEVMSSGSLGARRYLWTANAPAIVVGLAATIGDRPFILIGSGMAGVRVRRVSLDALRPLVDDPATAPAIDRLIENFTAQASAALVSVDTAQATDVAAPVLAAPSAGLGTWERLADFQAQSIELLAWQTLDADAQARTRLQRKKDAEHRMLARGMEG